MELGPLPPLVETAYVGQKLIFSRSVYWSRTNGHKASVVPGTSYFCRQCNEIWARRIVVCSRADHPEAGESFLPQVVTRPCEQHGDGSIVFSEVEWTQILDPDDYYRSHFPIEFLAYELFLIVRRTP